MSITQSPDIQLETAEQLEQPNAMPPVSLATAISNGEAVSHEAVAAEAYALYAARGYQDGWDVEDWLAAEDTLRRQRLDRES